MTDTAPQAGNGKSAAAPAPHDAFTDATQLGIITAQFQTIAAQIVMIRAQENALQVDPGNTPPATPPAGANLQNIINILGAAVRTQAAYSQHLADACTAYGVVPA